MACGYAAREGGEQWEVNKVGRWEVDCECAATETDGWILNFVFVELHCAVTIRNFGRAASVRKF